MPTLNWIWKEAVVNHHQHVPFHLLKDVPEQVVENCDYLARLIKVAQCEVKVDAALSVAAKCCANICRKHWAWAKPPRGSGLRARRFPHCLMATPV